MIKYYKQYNYTEDDKQKALARVQRVDTPLKAKLRTAKNKYLNNLSKIENLEDELKSYYQNPNWKKEILMNWMLDLNLKVNCGFIPYLIKEKLQECKYCTALFLEEYELAKVKAEEAENQIYI